MYSDNSLLPRETVRLAALGLLTRGPRSYAELAGEVRHFISRISGPSLELMGTSIELLRYEGLVAAEGEGEDALLTITAEGDHELGELLRTAVRTPLNDLNKLVMALKLRFLHLLDAPARRDQADMMIDACRSELARLVDLSQGGDAEHGDFIDWLEHDVGLARSRLDWLESFRARI